jgi:hypothetical protein
LTPSPAFAGFSKANLRTNQSIFTHLSQLHSLYNINFSERDK